jgi:hypothetical protein
MDMSRAMEMGSKGVDAAGGMGGAITDKFSFVQVGGKDSVAGVESAAAAAMAASQNAPAMAVNFATAGIGLAVTVAKAVLTATGAGAGIAAGIDAVQTAVNKGISKMNQASQGGAAINKPAAAAGAKP